MTTDIELDAAQFLFERGEESQVNLADTRQSLQVYCSSFTDVRKISKFQYIQKERFHAIATLAQLLSTSISADFQVSNDKGVVVMRTSRCQNMFDWIDLVVRIGLGNLFCNVLG